MQGILPWPCVTTTTNHITYVRKEIVCIQRYTVKTQHNWSSHMLNPKLPVCLCMSRIQAISQVFVCHCVKSQSNVKEKCCKVAAPTTQPYAMMSGPR